MAKKNMEEYGKILSILDTPEYKDKDGFVTLTDVESIFVALSDKVRSETIRQHINQMCNLRLLTKRGELSYRINENWQSVIKKFI